MRYLLDIIYLTLMFLASPFLAYSAIRYGKYREGIGQKLFGRVPQLTMHPSRVWFHAVSVGEVNMLAPILERLREVVPNLDAVISTTTKTGFALARQKYPDTTIFYCPLDLSWAVRTALCRIKPKLLVLVELELWPNLLTEAGRQDIPIAIINGRLSDRSTHGYLRLGGLMRKWMQNVTAVAAQSETCADRFVQLGVDASRVQPVGSVKFDGANTDRQNVKTRELAELIGIHPEDIVFVAGSTQAPEEALALQVFEQLSPRFPRLRLILVPRHPERGDEVAALLDQSGVAWLRRTQLPEPSTSSRTRASDSRVLLVDTVGELGGWWGCAHIGFVGGSMGGRGGQNMLEPSAYGVATCFGPNTKNFRDIVEQLLAAEAAAVVKNKGDLLEFVSRCLVDEHFRSQLGNRARQLVLSNRGAADATVHMLARLLTIGRVDFRQQTVSLTGRSTTLSHPNDPSNQRRRRA